MRKWEPRCPQPKSPSVIFLLPWPRRKPPGKAPTAYAARMLGLVVSKYLESRGVSDVQSELRFVADNCDPDTDFMFMRP